MFWSYEILCMIIISNLCLLVMQKFDAVYRGYNLKNIYQINWFLIFFSKFNFYHGVHIRL